MHACRLQIWQVMSCVDGQYIVKRVVVPRTSDSFITSRNSAFALCLFCGLHSLVVWSNCSVMCSLSSRGVRYPRSVFED